MSDFIKNQVFLKLKKQVLYLVLVDCKTKWDISKPIEGDKVKIRFTNEFNRIGKLKCIGTYVECCSTFTNSMKS